MGHTPLDRARRELSNDTKYVPICQVLGMNITLDILKLSPNWLSQPNY